MIEMYRSLKSHPLSMVAAFAAGALITGAITLAILIYIDPYGIH
jgi:hypothetical protein